MDESAGIVVVRFFDGDPRVLCLRAYSSFDLPKGHIEDGETPIETARRETAEEAGLTQLDFGWGEVSTRLIKSTGKCKKGVTLFIATTGQEPSIQRNPISGQFEHHGYEWLRLSEMRERLHPYLRPVVSWIESVLFGLGGQNS